MPTMSTNEVLFDYQKTLPGWIDNQPFETRSTYQVVDPHNPSTVLREVYGSNAEEANLAVAAAARALPGPYLLFHVRGIFISC